MKAVLVGGTGAVGQRILKHLVASDRYDSITSLNRRELEPQNGISHQVVDFNDLQSSLQSIEADHAYCALGTTKKKAGSSEAFRRVDHDYVLAFARGLRPAAKRLALVSPVGASSKSSNLYLRTKGEVEDQVKTLGYEALVIAQPGVLLTERQESRPGERIAILLSPLYNPLLQGGLRKYRGIDADTVAAALVTALIKVPPGHHLLHHHELQRFAHER